MSNNGKRIIVHKDGEEGAFHIDAMTGQVLTPTNELPIWANGFATALLSERVGWYEQRLGAQLPEGIRKPEALNVADLGFVAVDEAGDEVEIEASSEYRQRTLSVMLDIDTAADGWADFMKQFEVGAEVDASYSTAPTDEETLAEAEGSEMPKGEEAAKAANG